MVRDASVPLDTQTKEALLRASALVARYAKQHNVTLNVPQLLVIGMQSSGKSRLLATFAGRALGLMKSKTATRCATLFHFITSEDDAERCEVLWRGRVLTTTLSEVYSKIKVVMEELEAEDTFSTEQLEVTLELRSAVNMLLIDLPGKKPPNVASAERDNRSIENMWRKHANHPCVIPVIVTQMYDDPHQVENELNAVKSGLGKAAWEMVGRNTIVIAARLDVYQRKNNAERVMCEFLRIATEVSRVCERQRVMFVSLKPELYDPQVREVEEPDDVTVLNDYFANVREKEQLLLAAHMPARLCNAFPIGIACTLDVLTSAIAQQVARHIGSLTVDLAMECEELLQQAGLLINQDDPRSLRREAKTYVGLFCSFLTAFARWDNQDLTRDLRNADRMRSASGENVALPCERLQLTFDEEVESFGMQESRIVSLYRAALGSMSPAMQEYLQMRFSGGTALLRLLRVWKFSLLSMEHRSFTAAEMLEFGRFVDNNGTRQFSLALVLRKMVQENGSIFRTTTQEVCQWVKKLFRSHAVVARDEMREHSTALAASAQVEEQLSRELINAFDEYLDRQVHTAEVEVCQAIQSAFGSLKPDTFFAPLRLMCSAKFPAGLLKPLNSTPVAPRDSSVLTSVVDYLKTLALPTEVTTFVKAAMSVNRADTQTAVTDLFELCNKLGDVITLEELVFGKGVALPAMFDNEVSKNVDYINDVARLFTYMHFGITLETAMNVMDLYLEQPLKQLHRDVNRKLDTVLDKMSDDDLAVLSAATDQLSRVDELLSRLESSARVQREADEVAQRLPHYAPQKVERFRMEAMVAKLSAMKQKLMAAAPAAGGDSSRGQADALRGFVAKFDEAASGDPADGSNTVRAEVRHLRELLADAERRMAAMAASYRRPSDDDSWEGAKMTARLEDVKSQLDAARQEIWTLERDRQARATELERVTAELNAFRSASFPAPG